MAVSAMVVAETATLRLRLLTEDDVSAEWATWLDDPVTAALLNTPRRTFSEDQLRAYVRKFDQERQLLIGIFAKASNTHVGLLTIHTSDNGHDALLNVLMGRDRRALGGLRGVRDVRVAVGEYLFLRRKFRSAFASVLSDNRMMLAYLQAAGWRRVGRKLVSHALSPFQSTREVEIFQLSRQAWEQRNHILD